MKKLILLLFFPLILGCEARNNIDNIYQSIDLAPLRTNNTFSQPFRILKTKISDAALFDTKYGNTDLSIGYVLRYYFYTGIDLSADRTPHISQAQSINLFLPADVHKKDLHQIHYQAWKKGLKSLYYCRSKSIQRAENVNDANSTDITSNVYKSKNQPQNEENKYEECLSCQ